MSTACPFVTNLTLPAKSVWELYRQRSDSENRIKELKEDFGMDSFNVKDFFATEAALNFIIMAHNLMSLFRKAILGGKTYHQLKTLRHKLFNNRIIHNKEWQPEDTKTCPCHETKKLVHGIMGEVTTL